MPDRSDRVERAYEEADEGELPYISKSRVKSWLQNPEHFRFKYVEGLKPEETEAMTRGTQVHELFEDYYYATQDFIEEQGRLPDLHEQAQMMPDWRTLGRYVVPYASNFLAFEHERLTAADSPEEYLPTSVEEEHWIDPALGVDKEPAWMGLADAILPAASLPEVDSDSGVVVVDFKTGSVPDTQYRKEDGGIYIELEYYVMLFEDKYDVVGAAAYYPKEHELLVQPDDTDYREEVSRAVKNMVAAVASDRDHYERNEGPLCAWSADPEDRSEYYGLCNCTWAVPVDNQDRFEKLMDRELGYSTIADKMGTTTDAVSYWAYKLDLK